jgi:hypothetical protein
MTARTEIRYSGCDGDVAGRQRCLSTPSCTVMLRVSLLAFPAASCKSVTGEVEPVCCSVRGRLKLQMPR